MQKGRKRQKIFRIDRRTSVGSDMFVTPMISDKNHGHDPAEHVQARRSCLSSPELLGNRS